MRRVLLALVVGLVVYELVALDQAGHSYTISAIVWQLTRHTAIVPFAAGVLMGHFFWQKDGS